MSDKNKEPDFKWLEDTIIFFVGGIWSLIVAFFTFLKNLAYAAMGLDKDPPE